MQKNGIWIVTGFSDQASKEDYFRLKTPHFLIHNITRMGKLDG